MEGGFTRDLSRLLGFMFRLPLEVAVTTMDIFLRTVQEFPTLFDAAASRTKAAPDDGSDLQTQPLGGPPCGAASLLPGLPCPKEGPMSYDDCDLSGDDAKTIEYTITFIKPDYVDALEKRKIITIDYPTTVENFKGLRIGEFLKKLANRRGVELPARWRNLTLPRGYRVRRGRLLTIPPEDHRYIVCDIKLISRHEIPDAKREKEKVDVLREIRDRL